MSEKYQQEVSMSEVKLLNIDKLVRDKKLQPRAELNTALIEEYTDLWETWQDITTKPPFPPVTVVSDDKTMWLVDGYHRCAAAVKAGRLKIEALITPGTYRDAVLLSCKAHARHGLRAPTRTSAAR